MHYSFEDIDNLVILFSSVLPKVTLLISLFSIFCKKVHLAKDKMSTESPGLTITCVSFAANVALIFVEELV